MNDYEFDLNEIEEVATRPKKRIKHSNNYNMNNNNNNHHHTNNNHSNNHNHSHNHRKRKLFTENFGFNGKLLMTIFLISSFVLFFSFLINIILTIKGIITPRIFIPSIIIFILTFIFSGGILGTYVAPPLGQNINLRQGEILLMRVFTPSIMFIITIVFLIFGLENIKHLKNSIEKAQNICESHKGLSMEDIYISNNKTNYELEQLKYNLIFIFNKNLICLPKGKCIKIINEENNYICNTDEFIGNNDISDAKCYKINYNDEYINNIKKEKESFLFYDNCIEIINNRLGNIDIFKCESKTNLEGINNVQEWNENDKKKVEAFFNNKLDNYTKEIDKLKKIITNYENSIFNYDLECYTSLDYKLSYFMINIYSIIFYFTSFSWIYLGFAGMFLMFKTTNNNNGLDNNANRPGIKDINNLEKEEDNKLIIE